MDFTTFYVWLGNATYGFLAAVALLGAFFVVLLYRRIGQVRFKNEESQEDFLGQLEEHLSTGNYDAIVDQCEGDRRAMPQLVLLAVTNRELGYQKLRTLVADRFRRDVLSDLEYKVSWVVTCIKTAPMLGLYGTVLGMMGAFGKLASGNNVDPASLAGDISLALITTALGLTIAIPLIMCVNAINVRIRKMEDLVGQGLTVFFEMLKATLSGAPTGSR